jgi:hypothetical protein
MLAFSVWKNFSQKTSKKFKNPIDKPKSMGYSIKAVAEQEMFCGLHLENCIVH